MNYNENNNLRNKHNQLKIIKNNNLKKKKENSNLFDHQFTRNIYYHNVEFHLIFQPNIQFF